MQPIQRLFEGQVLATPDAVAVVCRDEELTYGELNGRANQLAHHLQRLGVGPEVLVGICLERSLEMVIAILGVLKVGGAYVPVDPSYPQERLSFLLQDTRIPLLITTRGLAEKVPSHQGRKLLLDADAEVIGQESRDNPPCAVAPENLAYVIYTSGSTGRPKGVMVTHYSLYRYVHSLQRRFDIALRDVYLHTASVAFSSSVRQLMMPLSHGAAVMVATSDQIANPLALFDLVKRKGVTIVDFVPSYWRNCIDTLLQLEPEPRAALLHNELRLILSASEPLASDIPSDWAIRLEHSAQLINMFGQTETTGIVATYPIPSPADEEIRTIPLGRAIDSAEIRLLDHHMQPVPAGVPGDLYVGGADLARGYLNRPELTADKFVPDPFGAPGSRLYKTGDMGQYSPEGNLEFLGRLDHQVKVRGYRVELGEIERALFAHPLVRKNVVVMREDSPGDKRLVAYIVPKGTASPSVSDLRHYLRNKLPEYMVPASFVLLNELPLTPNGKVDRIALPAPDRGRRGLEEIFEAPRSPVEREAARIWCEVLDLEEIGIHDNFLDLGGQSLLATRIISRLQRVLQTELTVRNLFENPTIASLSALIEKEDRAEGKSIATFERVSREGPLVPSFAQLRLWFLHQLEPDSPVYNIPEVWLLNGPLNITALEKSFNEVVRRHEALRTTFVAVDGRPVQVIAPALTITLELTDIGSLSESEQTEQVLRLAKAEAGCPFNLAKGPLVRGSVLQLSAEKHVLLVTTHHIVSDGWSSRIFMRELSRLYEAFSAGKTSPLPELLVQYADFAQWQRNCLDGEVIERHLSYWRRQLGGAPAVLNLPLDRPRPATQTFRGASEPFAIPKDLSEGLAALAQRENVTMFTTLLAAFQLLLRHYSGQEDIAVGSPIAGRSCAEIEPLIGFFVNTLVLRTDLSSDPTIRELLGRVREAALGALDHQELPFERLVEELRPERGTGQTPLFQVMLVLEDTPAKPITLSELSLTPLKHDAETVKFDLVLYMTYSESELSGSFAYNTDLFDRETIQGMKGHFQTLLEGIVADPDRRLSTLSVLTPAEKQQLLVEWNDNSVDYPREKCLHELFEAQAARTPAATAVVFEKQQLTYAELNARANQLARFLRSLGVGPETLVGICMERSTEMIIGLLGILKAGGSYVAFDPVYPKERISFMLHDTNTPVLLTEKGLIERMPHHQAHVVCLDSDWPEVSNETDENPATTAAPENLAYVIYTSGSTGKPKGVAIEHRSAVALLAWAREVFSQEELGGVLASTSICFDLSVFEIFVPLSCGGKVVLADNVLQLQSLEAAKDVRLINTVPSAMVELLRLGGIPKNVLTVNLAGEPLSSSLVEKLYEQPQIRRVCDLYGPSEDTTYSTFALRLPDGPATIGRPIANTQTYLLDPQLQPVPIGVAGELYLGGDGLARGYLYRPETTAERFIPNPFTSQAGERLYKTGDLARYLRDGNLEYVGRVDHQVKIRGFRIELGEIETVLRRHGAVQEALVVVREDIPGEKLLVAYVVPHSGKPLEAEQTLGNDRLINELRAFLKESLPAYLVPSAFVMLDTLPLTPNGKVDRRALPIPSTQRPVLATDYAEPQSGVEQTIAEIWQEVLKVERVGIHDNFFDLGGHSLLLTQVHARLTTCLNQDFPVISMFRYPTIDTLAKFLKPNSHSLHEPLKSAREKLNAGRNRREQVFQKRKIAEQSKSSK